MNQEIIEKQKPTTQRDKDVLIQEKTNKVQIWENAVIRAKTYLAEDRKAVKRDKLNADFWRTCVDKDKDFVAAQKKILNKAKKELKKAEAIIIK